jgi:hypothetical protein
MSSSQNFLFNHGVGGRSACRATTHGLAGKNYVMLVSRNPKMEAVCSSKTLVGTYKFTRCFDPDIDRYHGVVNPLKPEQV